MAATPSVSEVPTVYWYTYVGDAKDWNDAALPFTVTSGFAANPSDVSKVMTTTAVGVP